MEYSLKTAETGKQEIAQANYPDIRLCIIGNRAATQPLDDRQATWMVCSPKTCGRFSAVGFFFGKALHDVLKKPVGLIESSVAGTPAQNWTPIQTLQSDPVLMHYTGESGSLYNGMIAPLIPLAIKGAIWYQGESNAEESADYKVLFPAMIRAWRTNWGEGDFPFLFVQLPGFGRRGPATQPSSWAMMRDAQASALSLPATAMAVALDLSAPRAILHPKNKFNVGARLALAAENIAYGMAVPYQGPVFDSMTIEGNKIRIHFKYADGLAAHAAPTDDDPATTQPAPAADVLGFQISGDDRHFVSADAAIDGDSVVVSGDSVKTPVAVRFGWEQNPAVNLYNGAGLPAGPFRTDNWGQ
jgi:sialate O-acetylesterase